MNRRIGNKVCRQAYKYAIGSSNYLPPRRVRISADAHCRRMMPNAARALLALK